MTITLKLFLVAVLGFVVLNAVLTLIFGTISWLLDRFGWKAWVGLTLFLLSMGVITYLNFEELIHQILSIIQ